MNSNFKIHLKTALNSELPGIIAQQKLSPSNRNPKKLFSSESQNTINSSVVILIYPKNNKLNILFIKRATYKGKHSGQIAFPGGKYEKEDFTLKNTAIRETFEEIGVKISEKNMLGKLSKLFIPISNIMVYPYIAYLDYIPEFTLNKTEVEKIIEIEIADLFKPKLFQTKTILSNNLMIEAPYFNAKENHVWGATAMILSEFIEIIKSINL